MDLMAPFHMNLRRKESESMKYIVKNLNGSSYFPRPTCKCSDWIEHWIVNKGFKPLYCRCCGSGDDLVGGHVVKTGSYDKQRYITPICRKCNSIKDKEFEVDESDLVSANCDKCKNK